MRRAAVLMTGAAVLLPAGGASAQEGGPAAASGPNVVVVMTDDQRFDDMPALPKTQRLDGVVRARGSLDVPDVGIPALRERRPAHIRALAP